MRSVGTGKIQSIRDINVGELVAAEHQGEEVLAVLIAKVSYYANLGILSGSQAGSCMSIDLSKYCYNLGSEWLIDIRDASPAAPKYPTQFRAGSVLLDNEGLNICFHEQGTTDAIFFNVEECHTKRLPEGHSVLFDKHSIWRTLEDMSSPSVKPILQVAQDIQS